MLKIKDGINLKVLEQFGFKLGKDWVANRERFVENESDYDDYYNIGTAEAYHTLQELVDKETPMFVGDVQEPICKEDTEIYFGETYLCPKCKRVIIPYHFSDFVKINYCENCGQRLKWSEDND